MANSNYKKDYSEEDKELDEIEGETKVDQTPAEGPEEENWKKRYGDLRSHLQETSTEKNEEINKLKHQLEESGKKNTDIPVDPEQFKEWMETYPTVANNVRMIVSQEIQGMRDQLSETEKNIKTRDTKSKLEEAKIKLNAAHPDFYGGDNPIAKSKEFWSWLDKQEEEGAPNHKQNFSEGSNAKLASDSLKLYKLETNSGSTKKPKANSNDGASSIRSSNTTTPSATSNSEYKYTESQIENMNPREYDLLEDKIEEALRSGKVLMDLSGQK